MPLTPEDVSNKRFSPVRLREGYDMGEVDQFLDEVEAELARLVSENADLRAQLTAAGSAPASRAAQMPEIADFAGVSATDEHAPEHAPEVPAAEPEPIPVEPAPVEPSPVEPAAVEPAPETPAPETPAYDEPTVAPVVAPVVTPAAAPAAAAETLRVETLPQASQAAARLLEIAARNADELVSEATAQADQILGDARTEADRVSAEAKSNADQVESDARQRASMLDQETSDRREVLFGDLERERDRLESDVETLRSFEREYRSRLKSYFAQQLAALDNTGDASGDPASDVVGDVVGDPNAEQSPLPAAGDPDAGPPAEAPRRLRSILGEDGG